MGRGAGSKAISREEKRLKKEKEKRIREANRMLIPVPKITVASMKLLSFDPAGTFRFERDCWKRVYKVRNASGIGAGSFAKELKASVRITTVIGSEGEENTYMTLTENGETYDEVRTYFSEDEEKVAKHMEISLCSIDETMKAVNRNKENFSYASMVRGKKDWKKECIAEVVEDVSSFRMKADFGETLFVMQYPETLKDDVVEKLRKMGCEIEIAYDLDSISTADQIDFGRTLEQKFNRRGKSDLEFLNSSFQIMFLCDSDDARAIVEKTIISILSAEGFVIAPSIGAQKIAAESISSLGLLQLTYMRNVTVDVLDQINVLGGREDGSN